VKRIVVVYNFFIKNIFTLFSTYQSYRKPIILKAGVIDGDYTGKILLPFFNLHSGAVKIHEGEPLCLMVVEKILSPQVIFYYY